MSAPASKITGVPGWETDDEQAFLLKQAYQVHGSGRIVEIGAEFGMSASLFIKAAFPTVEIISVDLFPGNLLQVHQENLRMAGFAGRSTQIQGDSSTVGKQWDKPIDLLFIDGDHSYTGCKADIEAWIPHVKIGGVVIFHDCANMNNTMPHLLHFEVTKAVSEWYQRDGANWQAIDGADSILAFRRIK